MRKILAKQYSKGELKDIDLGPSPKKKNFDFQGIGNPSWKRGRPDKDNPLAPQAQSKPRIDFIIGGSKYFRESIRPH